MAAISVKAIAGSGAVTFGLADCTARTHGKLVRDLLPRGKMWPRTEGTGIWKWTEAAGLELSRIDKGIDGALRQADPCNLADYSLPEWERVCGLPNSCYPEIPEDVDERRANVCRVLSQNGIPNLGLFTEIADALGYAAPTVTRVQPFRANVNRANDPVRNIHHLATIGFTWASGSADALLECRALAAFPEWADLTVTFT